MVLLINPAITAIAIGERNEALSPPPMASGINAKMVVKLVIKIGLILFSPALIMDSLKENPLSLF